MDVLAFLMKGLKISHNSHIRTEKKMGLLNLGCTCYINATLQQLFMINNFKKCILEASSEGLEAGSYFYAFQ